MYNGVLGRALQLALQREMKQRATSYPNNGALGCVLSRSLWRHLEKSLEGDTIWKKWEMALHYPKQSIGDKWHKGMTLIN